MRISSSVVPVAACMYHTTADTPGSTDRSVRLKTNYQVRVGSQSNTYSADKLPHECDTSTNIYQLYINKHIHISQSPSKGARKKKAPRLFGTQTGGHTKNKYIAGTSSNKKKRKVFQLCLRPEIPPPHLFVAHCVFFWSVVQYCRSLLSAGMR